MQTAEEFEHDCAKAQKIEKESLLKNVSLQSLTKKYKTEQSERLLADDAEIQEKELLAELRHRYLNAVKACYLHCFEEGVL